MVLNLRCSSFVAGFEIAKGLECNIGCCRFGWYLALDCANFNVLILIVNAVQHLFIA